MDWVTDELLLSLGFRHNKNKTNWTEFVSLASDGDITIEFCRFSDGGRSWYGWYGDISNQGCKISGPQNEAELRLLMRMLDIPTETGR